MFLSPDIHDIKKFMPVFVWWLATMTVVVLLKHHYSVATVGQLNWVLQPLAQLLEWLTGHTFKQTGNSEWLSVEADVRLVKSCAGINFMIMSFLAYAWVLQPQAKNVNQESRTFTIIGDYLLMFIAMMIMAWATGLIANSFRILIAMHLQGNETLALLTGMKENDIHRLIGICIYAPLISLQMLSGDSGTRKKALIAPIILYTIIMLIVPVFSGNAASNITSFIHHVLQSFIALMAIYLLFNALSGMWKSTRSKSMI